METSSGDCPLSPHLQTRNLILFSACTALQYLAAPVGYIGLTQGSLCHQLGANDAVANLPETAYLGLTFAPVIFAWWVPYVSWLKRNLMICYGTVAVSQAVVAMALASRLSGEMKIAIVIAQAAIAGIMVPSAIAFLWEAIGRGAAEHRRGLALSLAFGVGPLFAVVGSIVSQLLLEGSIGGLTTPSNFAALYAAAAPCMALAILLSSWLVVPVPAVDAVRQPFLQSVFGGLWDFLRQPVLRTATIATLLIYTGNTITANLNLYSKEIYGDAPMLHAGYQNAARFGCKVAAGLFLGWLLSRTNPKAGLLATALTYLAAVVLAMVATAETYFLVFSVYGAGELVGVYAPNYLLSASSKPDLRRNLAFVTMMMAPAAPAGYLFGLISDLGGDRYGKTTGFHLSFALCALIMLAGILLAALKLPKHPQGIVPPRS